MSKTFGDLYSFLANKKCDNTHKQTKEFCRKNRIDFDKLYEKHLKTTGGCCCDCEILMNTVEQRQEDLLIKFTASDYDTGINAMVNRDTSNPR